MTVASVADERGRPDRCYWLIRDITARKATEAALADAKDRAEQATAIAETAKVRAEQAMAAAETANRAKDHFLAILSHELRTPLTPVVLTMSLLARRRDLPADVQDDLQTVYRNTQLEARLIDDLLDLTRIARGKMQFDFRAVNAHLVTHVAADICSQGDGARITLDLQAQHHCVRADAARLQQVFWNLLNNARKFTPVDGTISVHSMNTQTGRLRIEVRDTGVGIDPATLPKLFHAFEQDETDGKRAGGLGLGLTISKSIVEAHEGAIGVRSEGRGRGATFTVELPTVSGPATDVEAQPCRDQASPPVPERVLRILLVEDHDSTRNIMRKLLAGLGHQVQTAASVADAKAIAEREPFELVVSDLGLPDGSGHELMSWLRDRCGMKGIALSGYGMDDDLRKSREAGFAEHLTKPVNLEQFEAVISRVMGARTT